MNLKRKLALRSTLVCALTLLIVFSCTIYFYRKYTINYFYNRLNERAIVFATIFLEKDELVKSKYQEYAKKFFQTLNHESVQIYDSTDHVAFVDEIDEFDVDSSILYAIRHKGEKQFAIGDRQYAGVYYKDNQGNYVIVASGRNINGAARLKNLIILLSIFFIIGIIINYLLNVLLANRTFLPFSAILQKVNTISTGNLDQRLAPINESKDELNDLTNTLNMFLERLESGVNNQKQFLKNVSHELNTPLSAVIGQAEVSLESPRTNEEYQVTISRILKDATELKSILEGLLLLSGIRTTGRKPSIARLRLDELVWDILEKMKFRYPEAIINTSLEVTTEEEHLLEIESHRELLTTAMFNIIDNAIKYSLGHEVDIIIEVVAKRLILTVKDKGHGIPREELERIYDLFFRGSNVRETPGYGIGLSLTRQIAQFYDIDLLIDSVENKGTTVKMIFREVS